MSLTEVPSADLPMYGDALIRLRLRSWGGFVLLHCELGLEQVG